MGGAGLVALACGAVLLAKQKTLRACITRKKGLASTSAAKQPRGGLALAGSGASKDPHDKQMCVSAGGSESAASMAAESQRGCSYHTDTMASSSIAPASSSGLSSEAHCSPFAVFLAGPSQLSSSPSFLTGPLPAAPRSFRLGTQQQQQQQPQSTEQNEHQQQQQKDRSAEQFTGAAYTSYEGGLLPAGSVPMGQIPHALVVPFAELSLDQVIGAGAEGKVRT